MIVPAGADEVPEPNEISSTSGSHTLGCKVAGYADSEVRIIMLSDRIVRRLVAMHALVTPTTSSIQDYKPIAPSLRTKRCTNDLAGDALCVYDDELG